MTANTTIQAEWLGHLQHMLGATNDKPTISHGYRNFFCAEIGSTYHRQMKEMEAAGLVKAGRTINGGKDQYFYATLAGCQAIGLHKAAIKRALEQ